MPKSNFIAKIKQKSRQTTTFNENKKIIWFQAYITHGKNYRHAKWMENWISPKSNQMKRFEFLITRHVYSNEHFFKYAVD